MNLQIEAACLRPFHNGTILISLKRKMLRTSFSTRASADRRYFEILEVEPGASQEEIRAAYRKAIFRIHPDRNPKKDTTAEAARLNEAFEALISQEEISFRTQDLDVFDAPEEEATEIFVNPFDTYNPLLLDYVLEIARNNPLDVSGALQAAGAAPREITIYYLTPLQVQTLRAELAGLGPIPSPVELEVAEFFIRDALLRAQMANNRGPRQRRY